MQTPEQTEQQIAHWERDGKIPTFDPRVVAFHEASHAVATLKLGFTVDSVDIIRRIIPDGSDPLVGKIIYGTCRTSPSSTSTARDRMLLDLSGGVGEYIFSGVAAVGDVGDVSHILSDDGMREELTDILNANWAAVVEIAERLIAETTLDGATVREIVVKHCGDRPSQGHA